MLDLQSKGVKAEDVDYTLYKDFGMDFYGNGVIASRKYIAESGADIKAFNAPTAKAMRWVLANCDKAVEMVAKIDPLIDKKLERQRLDLAVETNILTPSTSAPGSLERMAAIPPCQASRQQLC